jgi:hypothetical protein
MLIAAAAAVAAISLATLGAAPANAAQDMTVSLSPASGTNYATDAATLSWTQPSACTGNEADAFIFKGTGPWDANAINTAEGNKGAQTAYYNFFTGPQVASANGSANWPNVSAGYTDFGTQTTPAFPNTDDLVNGFNGVPGLGTGIYTIGLACVNGTTFTPILDASGNPVAGTLLVQIGATGKSWKVITAAATQIVLTGTGTAAPIGNTVSLTASVTAANKTVPVGGVNFYVGNSATGTPMNGTTPVPVGSNGTAQFSGKNGYASGAKGAEGYTAQFVPANQQLYTPSVATGTVDLIAENVTIAVTAKQDPASPSTLDLRAVATGSPTSLAKADAGGGVDFVVDGTVFEKSITPRAPFPFNGSGVATAKIAKLKLGKHTVTALLETVGNLVLNGTVGYGVTVNTATLPGGPYASATAVTVAQTAQGLQVTSKVTGTTSTGQAVTLVPTGTITVKDGSVTLGSAKLSGKTGSGAATATVTGYSLPAGVNNFTATFAPANADFLGSTGTKQVVAPKTVMWVHPGSPVIAGKAAVGDTLTVKPGTWSPAGAHLSFQWLANGSPVPGATSSTLVLGAAQFGKTITVDVTGSAKGFQSVEASSPATAKVGKGTLKSSRPKITGTPKVGNTLRVSVGSWTPGTHFSYQWFANGKAIRGAKGSSLKLTAAMRGKRIEVAVTGTKTDYNTVTVMSAQTGRVAA